MFSLPTLPYAYDALEPHFDARTMEIHHTKHHQGYTDKLNAAIKDTDFADQPIEELLGSVSTDSAAVRNNGGGFYNHSLFWSVLSPAGGGEPEGPLADHLIKEFDSFAAFKEAFAAAAAGQFGSGWAWLIITPEGELRVSSTPNQDNPLMDVAEVNGTPILGLDVWEHAYYLSYQNRRPDYIEAFWHIVNWEEVARRYELATG